MVLAGFGRFSEPALLILSCMLDGEPKHGYAISSELESTYGRHLGPGTLYGALGRLEKAELIEPMAPEERRNPYRLTDRGLAAAADEIQHLERVSAHATYRLSLRAAQS